MFECLNEIIPPSLSSNPGSRFQGFCVDLIEHIAETVGFNYVIELVPDNNYGALNLTTQKWNGLVRGKPSPHLLQSDLP